MQPGPVVEDFDSLKDRCWTIPWQFHDVQQPFAFVDLIMSPGINKVLEVLILRFLERGHVAFDVADRTRFPSD